MEVMDIARAKWAMATEVIYLLEKYDLIQIL
jgi:hypothetical protein